MRHLAFPAACLIGGAISAYYAQPYVNGNSDLIMIIITVVTVFAGFLIAIIALIGDPTMIPGGSWRIAEGRRDRMEQRLIRNIALFIFYLVTIAVLFVGVILSKALSEGNMWRIWIERAYLFFGITSFLLTFALPFSMFKQQRERYDAETESRRTDAGLGQKADDHKKHK